MKDFLKTMAIWIVLVGAALFILSHEAHAYPETIRRGYTSCSSCHVSPSGGGALTGYGRTTASEFLSTWSDEAEDNPVFGYMPIPEWFQMGGDTRYININVRQQDGTRQHQKFLMQSDYELAVQPIKGLTFDASAGIYGPDEQTEYRRFYVKLEPNEHVRLRAGRFFAAYGVMVPDHTISTREGLWLGEGQETYNVEASAVGSAGEVFVTGIMGSQTSVQLSGGDGVLVPKQAESPKGMAVRAQYNVSDTAVVGVSAMQLTSPSEQRQAAGVFTLIGLSEQLYLLGDLNVRRERDVQPFAVTMERVGYEVHRGVHLTLQHELYGKDNACAVGLLWYPRPHWEFEAEYKREIDATRRWTDSGILMLHHYL